MAKVSAKDAARTPREPIACTWQYPENLPVSQAREEILAALEQSQILILCGATGSGKSTQLPKFCLEAGRGCHGLIAHTQPRRLAARALAERVAEEIGEEAGGTVGWQVRFKSVTSENTRVKLLTDGVLLNELRHDRLLKRYDTIIIDEAHERSLNIDFLLGYIKRIASKRPDLKIIITSATLDAEKFSRHFNNAPVIQVPGKSHPIELRYRDPDKKEVAESIAAAVAELWRDDSGDILVFLPGEGEIRETAAHLNGHVSLKRWADADILPLFARLGSARQQKIFKPGNKRRIVLATNVAETSLTVPGIRHVIDSGTARISRYNPRSKIQNLQIEDIAQANADQRKGRCGRTAPGICIRLYAQDDFDARPRYTEPEIQRTNLASVLLQMADLGLGEAEDFPFIDPPHRRYLNDARRLLSQLQALREDGRLSKTGRQLARFPLDPRMGRILLAARHSGIEDQVRPIVAALSMQDPRERDSENRQKSDQAQAPFQDKSSDFISLLNLWQSSQNQYKSTSQSDYRRWCKTHYLNARRMQEWRDLVKQIRHDARRPQDEKTAQPKPTPSDESVDTMKIHQALLSGLLDHIALHDEKGEFRGPRDARWRIHPESALAKKPPAWMVAGEIVHTRRTYARSVAKVEPDWIEAAATHLVQRNALEPSWDSKRGEVIAREQVVLFGLILVADRRVAYANYDAQHARRLFIEHALVGGRWGIDQIPAFLRANLELSKRVQAEENKTRRRDLLRTDDELIDWYAQRLPAKVNNRQGLLAALDDMDVASLKMQDSDVRNQDGPTLADAYPSRLQVNGQTLRLQYIFDPGQEEDGVNLDVPIAQLNQLTTQRLEWLVPGLLDELLESIIKALPKAQRRAFVPVNETVKRCLEKIAFGQGDLYQQLARQLTQIAGGQAPSAQQLRAADLPERLKMRIRIRDSKGRLTASGRQLDALKAQMGDKARTAFAKTKDPRWDINGLRTWDKEKLDESLPESVKTADGLLAWPSLKDDGDSVSLQLVDDPEHAQKQHARGVLRLLLLAQSGRLKPRLKSLPDRASVILRLAALPHADSSTTHLLDLLKPAPPMDGELLSDLAARSVQDSQLQLEIRSLQSFELAMQDPARLAEQLHKHWRAVQKLADAWAQWQTVPKLPTLSSSYADIQEQLMWLLAAGWISRTPVLDDLPRFIQALCLRAQRYAQHPLADEERMALITPHWQRCKEALNSCAKKQKTAPQALIDYRWLIEEYRVSVFAQSIRTRQKVSAKRLDALWQALRTQLPH
ncbi:MAG: ATP-dependent RNA helicase HrpA [Oceanococcus sp.]